jgi:coronin-1B/1C/6
VRCRAELTSYRKVGHVLFNPAAENVLASSSGDYTVKLWDLEDGQAKLTLKHNDMVQSLSWSADGNMLCTTSRDKKLRFWDVRQEKPAHEVPGHSGAKSSRVVWLGDHDRVATTGFSKMSDRQLGLWDPRNPSTPIGDFTYLDSQSGICMPFWDDGSQMLYLAGKGDGNIRYFEYDNDKFEPLSEHKSPEPQRGLAFMPKRGVNTHANEVMRAYKTVNDQYIEPISFVVPRRAEMFQDDIYPPATGSKPAMSSGEWLEGKTARPAKIDMGDLYDGTAPKEYAAAETPSPSPAKSASAPAPTPVAAPKAEPVVERSQPATPREMPSMKDNQNSMSEMASKFADKDAESSDDEPSSPFEEIPKPIQRPSSTVAARQEQKVGLSETPKHVDLAPTPVAAASAPEPSRAPAPSSRNVSESPATTSAPAPEQSSADTSSSVPSRSASSAAGGLKEVLGEIRGLLQAQSRQIEALTNEVAELKMRVN